MAKKQVEVNTLKTMEIIKANTEFLVALPWNGKPAWFKIFMLNATQLSACGNFSVLPTMIQEDEKLSESEHMAMIKELKNTQENVFKLALASPSFAELSDMYDATDTLKRVRKTLIENAEKLKELPDDDPDKAQLEREQEMYVMFTGFTLPDDFTETLIAIIYQRNNSDILKTSEDMLLRAAFLAERGKNSPHDHIHGNFTEFHQTEIDRHGWYLLSKFREEQEIERSAKKGSFERGSF